MPMPDSIPYLRGSTYRRKADIHDRFGGQRQGGISTPATEPYIFLFTGISGEAYGYQDGWDPNGVFRYTGEGQVGDMGFRAGNKAIRDHAANGKDLLLFQTLGKGKPVRFLGTFGLASYELVQGKDKNEEQRKVIVFNLVPTDDETASETLVERRPERSAASLEDLRKRAYAAATSGSTTSAKTAVRTYRERSDAVRDYVLARARGICESCGAGAPFVRPDGSSYLEPHHTRRLSDGGPDHPRHVGAVCPNCHREIHCGRDGNDRNLRLQETLRRLEGKSFQ